MIRLFVVFIMVFCTGCAGILHRFGIRRGTAAVESESFAEPGKVFYVYTDEKSTANHYIPSGWMGDTMDLKLSGSYQVNPSSGTSCLRITYLAQGQKEWAGICWQNPANNWGDRNGGYDLSGADEMTFWARGEEARETVAEFKIGGITGRYSDSDVAWIGPVKLGREWKQYRIPLKGKDMSYIIGGFSLVMLRSDNPHGCTLYLDEIRYEWEKEENEE